MSDIERTQKDKSLDAGYKKIATDNDIFNNDLLLVFFYKKTERLVSGVHLVTDHIDQKEPIRTSVRTVSVRILRLVVSPAFGNERERLSEVLRGIGEILGYINILASSRYVAIENARVLEEEYRKLAAIVIERGEYVAPPLLSFEHSFFSVPVPNEEDVLNRDMLHPYISLHKDSDSPRPFRTSPGHKDSLVRRNTKQESFTKGKVIAVNDRRDRVLKVLDARGTVTVKDVAAIVKDCSEKTIQRELVALVSEGVLTREGQRRWSVYRRAVPS